jgi:hypothetical protein
MSLSTPTKSMFDDGAAPPTGQNLLDARMENLRVPEETPLPDSPAGFTLRMKDPNEIVPAANSKSKPLFSKKAAEAAKAKAHVRAQDRSQQQKEEAQTEAPPVQTEAPSAQPKAPNPRGPPPASAPALASAPPPPSPAPATEPSPPRSGLGDTAARAAMVAVSRDTGVLAASGLDAGRPASARARTSITRFEQIEPSLNKDDIGEHPLMLGDDVQIKDKTAVELLIPVDKLKNGAKAAGAVLGAGAAAVASNQAVVQAGRALSSAGARTGAAVSGAAAQASAAAASAATQVSEAAAPHLERVSAGAAAMASQAAAGASAAGAAVYAGAAPALSSASVAAGAAGAAVRGAAGRTFAQAAGAVNGWLGSTGWFGASDAADGRPRGPQADGGTDDGL